MSRPLSYLKKEIPIGVLNKDNVNKGSLSLNIKKGSSTNSFSRLFNKNKYNDEPISSNEGEHVGAPLFRAQNSIGYGIHHAPMPIKVKAYTEVPLSIKYMHNLKPAVNELKSHAQTSKSKSKPHTTAHIQSSVYGITNKTTSANKPAQAPLQAPLIKVNRPIDGKTETVGDSKELAADKTNIGKKLNRVISSSKNEAAETTTSKTHPLMSEQNRSANAKGTSKSIVEREEKLGNTSRKLVGLTNMGNTCFANAALQLLNNSVYQITEPHKNSSADAKILHNILDELNNDKNQCFKPNDLKKLKIATIEWGNVEDAHEALHGFMEILCKDEKDLLAEKARAKEAEKAIDVKTLSKEDEKPQTVKSFAASITGKFLSTITFPDGETSGKEENFEILTLQKNQSGDMIDCLENLTNIEEVDYLYEKVQKKLTIIELPKTLFIHISRHSEGKRQKETSTIEFPQTLQTSHLPAMAEQLKRKNLKYVFKGAINHIGGDQSGHYVTYIKRGDKEFIEYNDSVVSSQYKMKIGQPHILWYQQEEEESNQEECYDDVIMETVLDSNIEVNTKYRSMDELEEDYDIECTGNTTGDCLPIALCQAFKINDCLKDEMRFHLGENIDRESLDLRGTSFKNAAEYIDHVNKSGNELGDFELGAMAARWKCQINVFVLNKASSNVSKQVIGENKDVCIALLRSNGHIAALAPKRREFYINYKKFENTGEELSALLTNRFLGKGPESLDTIDKEDAISYDESDQDEEEEALKKHGLKIKGKSTNKSKEKNMAGSLKEKNPTETIASRVKWQLISPEYFVIAAAGAKYFTSVIEKNSKLETKVTADDILDDIVPFSGMVKQFKSKKHMGNIKETCAKMPRNILVDIDLNIALLAKNNLTGEVQNALGPNLCLECSGKNGAGHSVFKIFNDLEALRKHCIRDHSKINANQAVLNVEPRPEFKIVHIRTGKTDSWCIIHEDHVDHKKTVQGHKERINSIKPREPFTPVVASLNDPAKPTRNMANSTKTHLFLQDAIKEKYVGEYGLQNININVLMGNMSDWTTYVDDAIIPTDFSKVTHLWPYKTDPSLETLRGMPKNVRLDSAIEPDDIHIKYGMNDNTAKAIGPVICNTCSGRDQRFKKIYRMFNTIYEYREHCRANNLHDLTIDDVINVEIPKDFTLIRATTNAYYMRKTSDMPAITSNKVGSLTPAVENSNTYSIYGNNIRTACSALNKDYLHKFLIEVAPDFLLLNEVGKMTSTSIKNKDYKAIVRGRVAIVYKKCYTVYPVLDKLHDDHNLIVKVNCSPSLEPKMGVDNKVKDKELILYVTYIPPGIDHEVTLDDFLNKMQACQRRYEGARTVVFGDLNIDRDEFNAKVIKLMGNKNILYHYNKNKSVHTRIQKNKNKTQSSYLDYMISFNLSKPEFQIKKMFAKTDHLLLELKIQKDQLNNIQVTKILCYGFQQCKKDTENIKKELIEALDQPDNIKAVENLIIKLRKQYKPRIKKARSIFNWRSKIKVCLTNKVKDWDSLANAVKRANTKDFHSFLKGAGQLGIGKKDKEFFVKMHFLTKISEKSGLFDTLETQVGDELVVTSDKTEIDKKIREKYKKVLKDTGWKNKYETKGAGMTFTSGNVDKALSQISLLKATSWDFIPGTVFVLILKDKITDPLSYWRNCTNIARLLTDLVNRKDDFPRELFLSRLMILNKEPLSNGKLENTRPIAINGCLFKILEKMILIKIQKFNKQLICKNQVGFIKGLGCDVNIARLRVKAIEAANLDPNSPIFVLFVDLKQAYDSVDHELLFKVLKDAGVDNPIVNTIMKIYSNAFISNDLLELCMCVNRGLLQGSIISPFLFNCFINAMIIKADSSCHTALGYADDIAAVCGNYDQLINTIRTISEWSAEVGIEINHKKSGILVYRNNINTYGTHIEAFPIRGNYKYLGVVLDSALSPRPHLLMIEKKLQVYLLKNKYIIKKYFSTKTLIDLAGSFQTSRIVYGACCFLDQEKTTEVVERLVIKYIKSIAGLKDNVQNNAVRATLGIPKMEYQLYPRLMKVFIKYEKHFGEVPEIYKKIIGAYNDWTEAPEGTNDLKVFKQLSHRKGLRKAANRIGIELGENYEAVLKEHWYRFPDGRDGLVIRYMCNYGFIDGRLFEKCLQCGIQGNNRTHATNSCKDTRLLKEATIMRLKKFIKMEDEMDLEGTLLKLYYRPDPKWTKSVMRELVIILKTFSASLYIDRGKAMKEPGEDQSHVSD